MIESASNPRLKLLRSLRSTHTRSKRRMVLLEGLTAVREAMAADVDLVVAVIRAGTALPGLEGLERALRERGVPLEVASAAAFASAADTTASQGVIAAVREPREERERLLDPSDPRPLALLCGLQDPGNLGAVLRSCAAFSFRGALLTQGTVDPYSPKVVRASAATVLRLPLVRGREAVQEAMAVRAVGFQLACAVEPGAAPREAFSALAPAPVALAVGNEGRGLDPGVAALADARVWIPIEPGVESLNAAVAFSVLAYELAAPLRARP